MCTTPEWPSASGAVPLVVSYDNGQHADDSADCVFHFYAQPTVERLSPNAAPTTGGTLVRLMGGGFVDTSAIKVKLRSDVEEKVVEGEFVDEFTIEFEFALDLSSRVVCFGLC